MTEALSPLKMNVATPHIAPSTKVEEPIYKKMEETQSKVDAALQRIPVTSPPKPLHSYSEDTQQQVNALLREIATKMDGELPIIEGSSSARRLFNLAQRVAEVCEEYFSRKQFESRDKKLKIEENIASQVSITNIQGFLTGGAGVVTLSLQLVAALGSGSAADLFKALSQLSQPTANMLQTFLEAKKLPLTHEHQFFMNTTQSERQTLDKILNLPSEIRQLVLELLRLESHAIQSIAQK